jgi:integrase/recombinase XerD
MTISATLKGRYNRFNMRTIYIRVADGDKRKFTPTKLKIEDKHWDFGKSQVKPTHANYKAFNAAIKTKISEIESGKLLITTEYFEGYYKKCLKEWDRSKTYDTLRSLRSRLEKFAAFAGNIKLDDVTPTLLKKYVDHCYSLGNNGNTVWSCLKCVRVVIRKAHKEKMISDYPFDMFEMPKYRNPIKSFLTKEQVDTIDKFCFNTEHKELIFPATWFVISCYTGLRFGDMTKFDKKKIKNGRLIIYTAKTGQPVSIKMNEKLQSLFELVKYQPIPYTNTHYNRYLKAIGVACDIGEKLSAHVARHTFGTLGASAGISQEVTAKLMGHSSIKTTAIYYQLTADRLDSEVEKIF